MISFSRLAAIAGFILLSANGQAQAFWGPPPLTNAEATSAVDNFFASEHSHESCIRASSFGGDKSGFGDPPQSIELSPPAHGHHDHRYVSDSKALIALVGAGILEATTPYADSPKTIRFSFTELGVANLQGPNNSCLRFADAYVNGVSGGREIGKTYWAYIDIAFRNFRPWTELGEVGRNVGAVASAHHANRREDGAGFPFRYVDGQWQNIGTSDHGEYAFTADAAAVSDGAAEHAEDKAAQKAARRGVFSRFLSFDRYTLALLVLLFGHPVALLVRRFRPLPGAILHGAVTVISIVPIAYLAIRLSNRTLVSSSFRNLDVMMNWAGYAALGLTLIVVLAIGFMLTKRAVEEAQGRDLYTAPET